MSATKGPWTDTLPDEDRVDDGKGHVAAHVVHRTADGRTWFLATVHGDLIEGDPFDNARLIAAAPEMAEQLQEDHKFLSSIGYDFRQISPDAGVLIDRFIERIDAALAKAGVS